MAGFENLARYGISDFFGVMAGFADLFGVMAGSEILTGCGIIYFHDGIRDLQS